MKAKQTKLKWIIVLLFLGVLMSCKSNQKDSLQAITSVESLIGDWSSFLPSGHSVWLSFFKKEGKLTGEIWNVGMQKKIVDPTIVGDTLFFKRNMRTGKPDYSGGPPTGIKKMVNHKAFVKENQLHILYEVLEENNSTMVYEYVGSKLPPIPAKPDLDKVSFGDPITLFNGKDLNGWKLTNENQLNGWNAKDGVLINETPKLSFDPFSHYGNLRTVQEFKDFKLHIEFNVPKGGNSGVYLLGRYEAQVVDRDSKMQGKIGVGSVFSRIKPLENAGKDGGEWQYYDITLVDRYITIILNGKKVIDNKALEGPTPGALNSDVTKSGPIYLQGDHTAVKYRNIVLRPKLD